MTLSDTVTLREYFEALGEERDRRYTEVNVEKEKALKIKETADLAALQLAREIQTYKDEKANELRSQIERERGSYVTQADHKALTEKLEALVKPITDFMVGSKQVSAVKTVSIGQVLQFASVIVALITVVVLAIFH